MINRKIIINTIFLLLALFFIVKSNAQIKSNTKHNKVVMRMIGNQLLLISGDSTSLILPIENEENKYTIKFENDFQLNSEKLVNTVQKIIKETKIARQYLVEVENCDSEKIIYNYENDIADQENLVPCKMRPQPKECYILHITLFPVDILPAKNQSVTNESKVKYPYLIAFIGLLIGGLFFIIIKKKRTKNSKHSVTIGKYQFDKKGMKLTLKSESIELSSKESDLLFLLYSNENKTLAREHILNIVWGDDGVYIGRTLDVFISKLRKKLESDPNLKIVNIRGVGYRFVMN